MLRFFKDNINQIGFYKKQFGTQLDIDKPEDKYQSFFDMFRLYEQEENSLVNDAIEENNNNINILNNSASTSKNKAKNINELQEKVSTHIYNINEIQSNSRDTYIGIYLAAKEEYNKTPWYKRIFSIPTWIKEARALSQIKNKTKELCGLSDQTLDKIEGYINDPQKADELQTKDEFLRMNPTAKYDVGAMDEIEKNTFEFAQNTKELDTVIEDHSTIKEEDKFFTEEDIKEIEDTKDKEFEDTLKFSPTDIYQVDGNSITAFNDETGDVFINPEFRTSLKDMQEDFRNDLKDLFEGLDNTPRSQKVTGNNAPVTNKQVDK